MMFMERVKQYSSTLFFSSIFASSLVSFALCLVAELKKSKKNELRLDGNLCYLPKSAAFELGIASLICLSIAQVNGNLFVYAKFCSRDKSRGCNIARKPTVSCILLVFSWISFGIAVILISVATSMSRSQAYGDGWLDGECYLVKDGVFVGSGVLALAAIGSIVGSAAVTLRRMKTEENKKIYAQVEG